jgi:hypothetical protein
LKRDERRALSLLAVGFSYREIGELTGWSYTGEPLYRRGADALRKGQSAK